METEVFQHDGLGESGILAVTSGDASGDYNSALSTLASNRGRFHVRNSGCTICSVKIRD